MTGKLQYTGRSSVKVYLALFVLFSLNYPGCQIEYYKSLFSYNNNHRLRLLKYGESRLSLLLSHRSINITYCI